MKQIHHDFSWRRAVKEMTTKDKDNDRYDRDYDNIFFLENKGCRIGIK